MAELRKRWSPVEESLVFVSPSKKKIYRWFLNTIPADPPTDSFADGGIYIACVESFDKDNGPFKLEVWDDVENDWDEISYFNKLKAAKAVGRILAATELQRMQQRN
jgi:hypothetical protein